MLAALNCGIVPVTHVLLLLLHVPHIASTVIHHLALVIPSYIATLGVVHSSPLHHALSTSPVEILLLIDIEIVIMVPLWTLPSIGGIASTISAVSVSVCSLPWVVASTSVGVLAMTIGHHWSVIIVGCPGSILSELITHLPTSPSSSKLTIGLEAVVPVHPDDSAVEHRAIKGIDGKSCLIPGRILDKAEATWLHLDLVQAHDQIHYLSTRGEEFEELTLQGEEGEVAHIESCGGAESLCILLAG